MHGQNHIKSDLDFYWIRSSVGRIAPAWRRREIPLISLYQLSYWACFATILTYLLTYFLPYLLTPYSTVLLEKLTVCSWSRNSPHFMEPEGSLPHSQVPVTCPYPEPARSCPYTHIPLPEDPSYYYPPISIYAWVSPVLSFLQVSPPKFFTLHLYLQQMNIMTAKN